MAKTLAYVFGAVFIVVGLLGFVSNPIVGANGFFMADTVHNIVHILLGAVLLFGAKSAPMTLKVVAVIYLLVAILGFVMGSGKLLGLVMVNGADNWLHLVLAIALFAGSMVGETSDNFMPTIKQPMQ
jgi:zinc transporter ZupT